MITITTKNCFSIAECSIFNVYFLAYIVCVWLFNLYFLPKCAVFRLTTIEEQRECTADDVAENSNDVRGTARAAEASRDSGKAKSRSPLFWNALVGRRFRCLSIMYTQNYTGLTVCMCAHTMHAQLLSALVSIRLCILADVSLSRYIALRTFSRRTTGNRRENLRKNRMVIFFFSFRSILCRLRNRVR